MSRTQKVILTITIDTECDHDPNWARSSPIAFESIYTGIPDRLQPAFESVGAVPTYLLTVEVMEDKASVETLNALKGNFEYGTHLHAAFIEPEKKFADYAGIDSPDFQCSYTPEVEYKKLENLTKLFESCFSYKPVSFRAGRYGANHHSINSLEKLGYLVDTSVTPHIRWEEPNAIVDFRKAPEQPYFNAIDDIAKPGQVRDILQVPVTVKPRFMRGPRWFRPWFATVDQMKAIVNYHLKKYADREVLNINMMFHSMEVIPKASPYPQTEDDAKRFIDDMVAGLSWCKSEGIELVAMKDFYKAFTGRE